jgi:nicotinamidase-related amidase
MVEDNALRFGALSQKSVHICVDMQRLFAEDTDWHTPWMGRVLPKAVQLAAARPERTIFTRFIPAEKPGEGEGTWRRYYQNWASMTVSHLGRDMIELVPELAGFVPPGELLDKRFYSPWIGTELEQRLRDKRADTVIVSGGETDVCVLATVLGAVDRGYRVVVATDALCSSSDEAHDAMMTLYEKRYGQQVETVTTEKVLESWREPAESAQVA